MEILLLIGKFPVGKSGATSKTGLALGFCGDSFSASPWGGVYCMQKTVPPDRKFCGSLLCRTLKHWLEYKLHPARRGVLKIPILGENFMT